MADGRRVGMAYHCLAFGIMSFWIAFVVANAGNWKQKTKWCLVGCFGIWVINCLRVGALLVALDHRWNINRFAEHHTMFNIFAYSLILVLMYIYTRKLEKGK